MMKNFFLVIWADSSIWFIPLIHANAERRTISHILKAHFQPITSGWKILRKSLLWYPLKIYFKMTTSGLKALSYRESHSHVCLSCLKLSRISIKVTSVRINICRRLSLLGNIVMPRVQWRHSKSLLLWSKLTKNRRCGMGKSTMVKIAQKNCTHQWWESKER